jgi:hypothetical protein
MHVEARLHTYGTQVVFDGVWYQEIDPIAFIRVEIAKLGDSTGRVQEILFETDYPSLRKELHEPEEERLFEVVSPACPESGTDCVQYC